MVNELALDLSEFPEELNVMLGFMRTNADSDTPPSIEPPLPNIDWNQFVKLVRHHRVYPQMYSRMKNSKLIPADVLQALYRDYETNTFRMLRLSAEMERVCASLERNGIASIVLKGPALAKELYDDLSLRTCKDLDILIPMADVEEAEEILVKLGYASDKNVPRVAGNWKWKVHHISYTHPQTGIQLEIHWRLNSDMGKEPPFETLWKRRKPSSLAGGRIYMLGDEDLFMYLVSHGARHGWFRLRWLADIDRMARRSLNWAALIPLMKRYGCVHLGGQALVLASGLLGTPIPGGGKPMLSGGRGRDLAQRSICFIRDMVAFSPVPSSKELARTYKRYLFALKTSRQKASFVIGQLYPSFRDAEVLPLPKSLHFLYFPLRPFVWLWRQIKQQA